MSLFEERRKSQRESVQRTAYISHLGSGTRCSITNISAEGAAIEVPDASHIPIRFQLMTETDRIVRNCCVVWIKRNKLGVQFEDTSQFGRSRLSSHEEPPVPRAEIPTHPQRQFMQYLRARQWVPAISLPDRPKVVARLLNNGWIERDGNGSDAAYRLTFSGLAAKTTPVQILRK
jgi:hypothetical protein